MAPSHKGSIFKGGRGQTAGGYSMQNIPAGTNINLQMDDQMA